jgi:hypothetical protein
MTVDVSSAPTFYRYRGCSVSLYPCHRMQALHCRAGQVEDLKEEPVNRRQLSFTSSAPLGFLSAL